MNESKQAIIDAFAIAGVIIRKVDGIDCDEDESALIKRQFDRWNAKGDESAKQAFEKVSELFPLEYAEWVDDVEAGRRGKSLTRDRSRRIAALLNEVMPGLPEPVDAGGGMGYDGIAVGLAEGFGVYFDTTYGGDDGYTEGLRTYVTLRDGNVDDDWPAGPSLAASDEDIRNWAQLRIVDVMGRHPNGGLGRRAPSWTEYHFTLPGRPPIEVVVEQDEHGVSARWRHKGGNDIWSSPVDVEERERP